MKRTSALFFVFILLRLPTGCRRHALSLHATRASTAERRVEGEVNVLLAIGANHEGGHVDDLLADANVALTNENARVVHRLGEAELEHERLKASLQELFGSKTEHVIEAFLGFLLCNDAKRNARPSANNHKARLGSGPWQPQPRKRSTRLRARRPTTDVASEHERKYHKSVTYQQTVALHASQNSFPFEDALGILLIHRQQHPRGVAKFIERKVHAPKLALVAQAEFPNNLKFSIEALLFERTSRLLEGFTVCSRESRARDRSVSIRAFIERASPSRPRARAPPARDGTNDSFHSIPLFLAPAPRARSPRARARAERRSLRPVRARVERNPKKKTPKPRSHRARVRPPLVVSPRVEFVASRARAHFVRTRTVTVVRRRRHRSIDGAANRGATRSRRRARGAARRRTVGRSVGRSVMSSSDRPSVRPTDRRTDDDER